MADIQYFGGVPEVGIVPRAPHAGPLYMKAWAAYTTDLPFAYDPGRLDDVHAAADRLTGARDLLRPQE